MATTADIGENLQALLRDATRVRNLVGDRISPDVLDDKLPAISYEVTTSNSQNHLSGSSGYAFSRVTFECHAITRNQANRLGYLVIDALSGFRGTSGAIHIDDCFVDNKYNKAIKPRKGSRDWQYVRVVDFEVSHTEPLPSP